jgi:hypothetical protein
LRDRGRGDRAGGETDAACFQKFTTFHALPPPLCADASTRETILNVVFVSFADGRR